MRTWIFEVKFWVHIIAHHKSHNLWQHTDNIYASANKRDRREGNTFALMYRSHPSYKRLNKLSVRYGTPNPNVRYRTCSHKNKCVKARIYYTHILWQSYLYRTGTSTVPVLSFVCKANHKMFLFETWLISTSSPQTSYHLFERWQIPDYVIAKIP